MLTYTWKYAVALLVVAEYTDAIEEAITYVESFIVINTDLPRTANVHIVGQMAIRDHSPRPVRTVLNVSEMCKLRPGVKD